jgi:16S rRNA (cytidine1402-2'-O)-methyltransferase
LPGATALIPAFVASGFSVHNFTFFGFPPQKKGRHTFVKNVLNNKYTSIIYESSHRIIKLISEIAEMDNNRNICVGREISKVFEEYIRINTADISNNSIKITEKGEFVVIIEAKH